jgi:hypothetical protein
MPVLAGVLFLALADPAGAGLADTLNQVKSAVESQQTGSSTSQGSNLSASEVTSGLKAALDKAAKTAVSSLGVKDGYLGNADVKIPMPGTLAKVESALRLVGQTSLADSFVTSMNRAAEQAVPETLNILGNAVKNMSIADAKGILNGGDTAATDFFKRTSDNALIEKIKPIVSAAMARVNVTQNYQKMTAAASAAGAGTKDYDLDGYVTRKSLDGLYLMMEREEANIRQNPVARTSDILKKVFGSK